jgi:hypothetical protein
MCSNLKVIELSCERRPLDRHCQQEPGKCSSMRNAYVESMRPSDPVEQELIDDMVTAQWHSRIGAGRTGVEEGAADHRELFGRRFEQAHKALVELRRLSPFQTPPPKLPNEAKLTRRTCSFNAFRTRLRLPEAA